jgi:hypothetical protein
MDDDTSESHEMFALAGREWPLTAPVKAYLEYIAIEMTGVTSPNAIASFSWDGGSLSIAPGSAERVVVLDADETVSTLFEDVEAECRWAWLRATELVDDADVPSDIGADAETRYTTQQRISQAVVWQLIADCDPDKRLREYARNFLGRFTDGEWRVSLENDPRLAAVKDELDL